jgi:hypothetical protein
MIITEEQKTKLKEEISDLIHQQWSHWTKYILDRNRGDKSHFDQLNWNEKIYVFTDKEINRWNKQIITDYKDLSEEDKDKDRKFADNYISVFEKYLKPKEMLVHSNYIADFMTRLNMVLSADVSDKIRKLELEDLCIHIFNEGIIFNEMNTRVKEQKNGIN